MKELNKDILTRDKMIFGKYRPNTYKFGGIRKFDNLDVETLGKLLEMNFADPEERQNLAPSIQEIYEFMRKYPKYKAHGYAVSDEREDYRISIEGVEKGEPHESIDEFQDYMNVFRFSDTFDYHTMFCWFD